jgi:hypothetical protein
MPNLTVSAAMELKGTAAVKASSKMKQETPAPTVFTNVFFITSSFPFVEVHLKTFTSDDDYPSNLSFAVVFGSLFLFGTLFGKIFTVKYFTSFRDGIASLTKELKTIGLSNK